MKEPLTPAGLIPAADPALTPAPDPSRSRPSATRLLQGDGANVIAFGFAPGQDLPDHKSAHPITVQCPADAAGNAVLPLTMLTGGRHQ